MLTVAKTTMETESGMADANTFDSSLITANSVHISNQAITTQMSPKGKIRLRLYVVFAVNTIVQRKANHIIKKKIGF